MTLHDVSLLAEWSLALLFSVSVKACALLLGAALLTRLLANRQAAARHLVWGLAFAGLALLPVLEVAVPVWSLPAPWASLVEPGTPPPVFALVSRDALEQEDFLPRSDVEPATVTRDSDGSPGDAGMAMASANHQVALTLDSLEDESAAATAAGPASVSAGWPRFSAVLVLAGVWALGACAFWAVLAWGVVSLALRSRRLPRSESGLIRSIADVAASQLKLPHHVDVRLEDTTALPATWGWLHPTVLLPASAQWWPAERIHLVLKHELAHVLRHDWLTQILALAATGFHWFNPFAWQALRQLRVEQEMACDDRVLLSGAAATDYAAELIAVLRESAARRPTALAALGISRPHDLEQRLLALLDGRRSHLPVPGLAGFVSALAALLLVAGLGTLRFESEPIASAAAPAILPSGFSLGDPVERLGGNAPEVAGQMLVAQAGGDGARGESLPAQAADAEQSVRIEQVRELIRRMYSGKFDPKSLDDGAVQGMLAALNDPHTRLVAAPEVPQMSGAGSAGCVSGIGAMFKKESQRLLVLAPLPGSPASRAGVKPGDFVTKIDGHLVEELGFESAIRSIAGPAGSIVTLELDRAGKSLEVPITRAQIVNPSIRGVTFDVDHGWNHWLDGERKIGYVRIGAFESLTPSDLQAVNEPIAGMRGLVVDLRSSPGGLLPAAVEIAQMFVPQGTLWKLRGATADQTLTFHADKSKAVFGEVPLVVVVDDTTASAAEMLAGTLQESGRAVVLGSRTYGKGSVQTIVPLAGTGQMLRLTTALIELPSGRTVDRNHNPERWGVDPNEGFWVMQ
ncbi:MAG: PDZ domain-containing protein, partial [Planctomycetaceae bacterium]